MKCTLLFICMVMPFILLGQEKIDPSKLPLVRYTPRVYVNGSDQRGAISIKELLKHGLQIVLEDKSFKVVQFDVMYDCHSRALFDFSVKRYFGDRVDPKDDYLRQLVLIGDVISIDYTVIERQGVRFRMSEIGYKITD
jgi:hypothetical protein